MYICGNQCKIASWSSKPDLATATIKLKDLGIKSTPHFVNVALRTNTVQKEMKMTNFNSTPVAVSIYSLIQSIRLSLKLSQFKCSVSQIVEVPFQLLKERAKVDVFTHDLDTEEGDNRDTAPTRIRKIRDDLNQLRPSLVSAAISTAGIFMDAFHVVIVVPKNQEKFITNDMSLVDILKLEGVELHIIDGAGRYKTISQMIDAGDTFWNQLDVSVRFYVNPSHESKLVLMETLNSKRAPLENDFKRFIWASLYDYQGPVIERYVSSKLGFMLAKDFDLPFSKGRVKFHDTTNDGINISGLCNAVADSLLYNVTVYENGKEATAYSQVMSQLEGDLDEQYKLLKAISLFLHDSMKGEVFGANWDDDTEYASTRGTMLQTLMPAAMYAALQLNWRPMSAKEIARELSTKYGTIFLDYLLNPKGWAKLEKFKKANTAKRAEEIDYLRVRINVHFQTKKQFADAKKAARLVKVPRLPKVVKAKRLPKVVALVQVRDVTVTV